MKPPQGKLEFDKPKAVKEADKKKLEPSEGISFDELVKRTGGERKDEK